MQITITTRHKTKLPEAVRELAESKILKLDRFGHKIVSTHLIVEVQKYMATAELILYAKGFNLVSKVSRKADLLTVVEEACAKLKTQLSRREAKRVQSARRRAAHAE
ncbi:MAG: ribosomal subunit interface protein [Candidatus Omnitrophica bacterium CG11_big_fil_rev_8_21_14_0_20_64_10]|nr:MAG: ribosomal subunit interface protein [Candidatus Omnitrophica bacterium CG11_big_fil_rev_8_21_14_0_20_64_10]